MQRILLRLIVILTGVFVLAVSGINRFRRLKLEHIQPVFAMDLHPDGTKLAISGVFATETYLWLYDLATEEIDIISPDHPANYLRWSPDGNKLLSTYGQGFIQISEVYPRFRVTNYYGYTKSRASMAWGADSSLITNVSYASIQVFDTETSMSVIQVDPPQVFVDSVHWDYARQQLYGLDSIAHIIYTWDATTGNEILHYPLAFDTDEMVADPDCNLLAIQGSSGQIVLLDATTGEQTRIIHEENEVDFTFLTWHPSGHYLAAYDGGSIWIWDIETRSPTHIVTNVVDLIDTLIWTSDGQELIYVTETSSVTIVPIPNMPATNVRNMPCR